jgi:hypothetical protein
VKIEFADASGKQPARFSGAVSMVTFGAEQCVWHPDGPKSHADPDGPPMSSKVNAKKDGMFTIPRASVTVLRGKVAAE